MERQHRALSHRRNCLNWLDSIIVMSDDSRRSTSLLDILLFAEFRSHTDVERTAILEL